MYLKNKETSQASWADFLRIAIKIECNTWRGNFVQQQTRDEMNI